MCADLVLMMEPGPWCPLHSGRYGRTVAKEGAGQGDLSMTEVVGLRAGQPLDDLAVSLPDLGLCEPSSLSHLSGCLLVTPQTQGVDPANGTGVPARCSAMGLPWVMQARR